MTYDELFDFVERRMRMTHVYQPLLLRTLLQAGGTATVRDIAAAFLSMDESQLRYYEQIVKRWPLATLKKHGLISRRGNRVALSADNMTTSQRNELVAACDRRVAAFLQSRGVALWDYRMGEADPVSHTVRYRVLARSGGRCALCGATKEDRPLHIDHIIPRARGGTNEESNLQVLCSSCNCAKRDRDHTDFRNMLDGSRDATCAFCSPETHAKATHEAGSVFALTDAYPVTEGHTLIIPFRHTPDYFTMSERERGDASDLLRVIRQERLIRDSTITGFNVGMNCGHSAGQTVMHAHIHLIPRRAGDTPLPRGGVRGVVPDRMSYTP